jgi:hypothetical protein
VIVAVELIVCNAGGVCAEGAIEDLELRGGGITDIVAWVAVQQKSFVRSADPGPITASGPWVPGTRLPCQKSSLGF